MDADQRTMSDVGSRPRSAEASNVVFDNRRSVE